MILCGKHGHQHVTLPKMMMDLSPLEEGFLGQCSSYLSPFYFVLSYIYDIMKIKLDLSPLEA